MCLDSSADETSVKFQMDKTNTNTNFAAVGLGEILRRTKHAPV